MYIILEYTKIYLLIFFINYSDVVFSQSIIFTNLNNGNILSKLVHLDNKTFQITGDTVVCKEEYSVFSISTNESAQWSNGIKGVSSSYLITSDTVIRAVVTNKYGCEFEKELKVKAVDLPIKPIILKNGDSLKVSNVSGHFEWYRDNLLFSVGLPFIITNLKGIYTVKVFNQAGCENISDGFNLNQGGPNQPPWVAQMTNENHTIIIPTNVQSNIGGTPLKNGDYIGVFFMKDGQLVCSNFIEWEGSGTTIAAFENELAFPEKNGFSAGEIFGFKVWKFEEAKEYKVEAIFEDPPQSPRDATDKYLRNALSMVQRLETTSKITQNIQLRKSWNMISSYIIPENSNMLSIIASLGNKVVLIKDENGIVTLPTGPDNLKNWNVRKGYKIRMIEEAVLSLTGIKANPATEAISLKKNWQIVSYLCDNGNTPSSQFGPISSKIVIVKDQDGNSFLPSIPTNSLKCLKPGLGYQIRALDSINLTYNCVGNCVPNNNKEVVYARSNDHIQDGNPYNSGSNATLIFSNTFVNSFLTIGQEILVYNKTGIICGKFKYTGDVFAFPVWGDDKSTNHFVEGFIDGEQMKFCLKDKNGRIEMIDVSFNGNTRGFVEDGIYYANRIENASVMSGKAELLLYPNPAFEKINFHLLNSNPIKNAHIQIYDINGRLLKSEVYLLNSLDATNISIDIDELHSGIYLTKVKLDNFYFERKFIVGN